MQKGGGWGLKQWRGCVLSASTSRGHALTAQEEKGNYKVKKKGVLESRGAAITCDLEGMAGKS